MSRLRPTKPIHGAFVCLIGRHFDDVSHDLITSDERHSSTHCIESVMRPSR